MSALLIGLPIALFVVMSWQWRWTHDDGFITLRVVDQVFAGNGPVYNAGQRVEVFTSPLHLFLLVVLRGLFGWALDTAWLGVGLTIGAAVAGLLAAVAGSARLARASGARGRLLPLGILVPVALPPMWEYGTSGLETGVAIGWVGISFWLVARVATSRAALPWRRLWPTAVVVGLGPLVRPEGAILTAALLAVLVTSRAAAPPRPARPAPSDRPASTTTPSGTLEAGSTSGRVDRQSSEGGVHRSGVPAAVDPTPSGPLEAGSTSGRVDRQSSGESVHRGGRGVLSARARRRVGLVATALALPLAYEVFRMGYYATVVPNTALAKEAGGSRWDQGWYYFVNFAGPYLLGIPVAVFVAWLVLGRRWSLTRTFGGRDGRNLALAMVAAAAIHTVYVMRVGGDYMHARMLLMPVFALCCPLAVVPQPKAGRASVAVVGCVAAMGGWALLVALAQRAPEPESFFGGHAIAEQRLFHRNFSGNPHPVTLDEWRRSPVYRMGTLAREGQAAGRDELITSVNVAGLGFDATPLPRGRGTVLFLDGIGVVGARAGVDVPVVDQHGLADPIASRMPILRPRGLPGHEKALPQTWAFAEAGAGPDEPRAGSAPIALSCGDIHRLLEAIDGPITASRFLRNLLAAPGFTTMEIPTDPDEAVAACE